MRTIHVIKLLSYDEQLNFTYEKYSNLVIKSHSTSWYWKM